MAATKTETKELKDLELKDLLMYEHASKLVCQKYENSVKMYDGTIRNDGHEYRNFEKYNNMHLSILSELEKRLNILL